MARFILGLVELGVSAAVHLLFGFYVFSTAVAADISQAAAASGCPLLRRPPPAAGLVDVAAAAAEEEDERRGVVLDGSPPPIVLVHGIFGFGKGRLGGMSYFAGAEKKDDRVLVPDLGSLTSIHDRARELFYYLKGGQVDYGVEHSQVYGHTRFGRIYETGEDLDEQSITLALWPRMSLDLEFFISGF
uniref:Lipase-like C-terminal domain-containing protein n=1 Tax=Triticum urartu TaxID=4572 RepID=A0A8R7P3J6_TRIUA